MTRVATLIRMPAISRDGVGFCWFARDIGARGIDAIHDGVNEQHPLYPLLLLAAQRLFRAFGAAAAPLTWQRAGQAVSLLAGAVAICAAGWAAMRLARALGQSRAVAQHTAWWTLLAFAYLPLAVWLSVDTMSDSLHIALYLVAAALLIELRSVGPAIALGIVAGLAFLTRPEGGLLLPAGIAALIAAAAHQRMRISRAIAAVTALCAAFLVIVGPYWLVLGGFSPKLNKESVDEFVRAAVCTPTSSTIPSPVLEARLDRAKYEWYEALGYAAYQTFRGGRVVIPLLGLIAAVILWRKTTAPALCGLNVCLSGHFLLTAALALRHGYLDQRHTLVAVVLLVVLGAQPMGVWIRAQLSRNRLFPGMLVFLVFFTPLVAYSQRVPNADDGVVRTAGEQLRGIPNFSKSQILVGGSNEKRIAFYADCRFQPWAENQSTPEARLEALRHELFDATGDFRPRFFAMEIDRSPGGDEDARLLARFSATPEAERVMRPLFSLNDDEHRKKLLVFELVYPK